MVGEVTFGVDENGGDSFKRGFFKQDDAHTGLTGTGHTGNDHVGSEVLWVVISQLVGDDRLGFKVVSIAKIKFRRIDFHK